MNAPAITVRTAAVADAPAIARIQVLGWDHAFGHIMSKEFRSARGVTVRETEWRERLGAPKPGAHHLIAEDAGEAVGIASGGPVMKEEVIVEGDPSAFTAQVYMVYVLPARIAGGIGRRLLAELGRRLSQESHRNVILWAFEKNPYSRFYERIGGRIVARGIWDIRESVLTEVAYGWDDIHDFIAACETSSPSPKAGR